MMQVRVVGVSSPGAGLAAEVCFASSGGAAFNVAVPPGQAEAVRRALGGASHRDVLEAWLFSELFDGDLTEVLIEEHADCRDFSLVFSSQGLPMRFSVTPLDAVLTGLRLGVPFLVAKRPDHGRGRLFPMGAGSDRLRPRQSIGGN